MNTDTLLAPHRTVEPSVESRFSWDELVACFLPILSGDAAFLETDRFAQFGHFESGIKLTLERDELLVSSSYSLLGGDASIVAARMREVVFAIEMATGRSASAVRFDQPELAAGDIAGRQRVHGYAFLASDHPAPSGIEHTMALHPSLLLSFDAHVAQRNP